MERSAVFGRYERLKRELADAYQSSPWHAGRIDRLAAEIADVEKVLMALQARAARVVGASTPGRAQSAFAGQPPAGGQDHQGAAGWSSTDEAVDPCRAAAA